MKENNKKINTIMEIRTLFFGEGIFETIVWKGKNRKLIRHFERLKYSAEFFHIPCPNFERFLKKIEEKLMGRRNLYVKVCLLTKGDSVYYSYPQDSDMVVIVKEYKPDTSPKKLCLSDIKRHSNNPVIYHKTMNYLPNILVKREALLQGFDDAVMLNENNEITECSSSNILIMKNNKLLTPAKESGLLSGTTMQVLIEKINVKEEKLKLNDLYNASCMFITNSLIGALPVSQFMDKLYPINNELLETIKSVIEEENLL